MYHVGESLWRSAFAASEACYVFQKDVSQTRGSKSWGSQSVFSSTSIDTESGVLCRAGEARRDRSQSVSQSLTRGLNEGQAQQKCDRIKTSPRHVKRQGKQRVVEFHRQKKRASLPEDEKRGRQRATAWLAGARAIDVGFELDLDSARANRKGRSESVENASFARPFDGIISMLLHAPCCEGRPSMSCENVC